jgi:hypothetical protein
MRSGPCSLPQIALAILDEELGGEVVVQHVGSFVFGARRVNAPRQ